MMNGGQGGDTLRGMAAIVEYSGYSKKIVKDYHQTKGFPMTFLGGAWESSKSMIEDWRRQQILQSTAAANGKN